MRGRVPKGRPREVWWPRAHLRRIETREHTSSRSLDRLKRTRAAASA